MSVFNALGAGVYTKLSSGTALTALLSGGTASGSASIYSLEAPFNASYDYVIFNVQTGSETNDTRHRIKDITLQVRAYATNQAKAGTIDAQCDVLLHNGSLTIAGWSCLWLVRSQDIEIVEYDESSRPIYTRGGLYDLKIERI
jgi:hypothetical protein